MIEVSARVQLRRQPPSTDRCLRLSAGPRVIELEEGTRLVANMTGIEPADVRIDMAVELTRIDADSDLTLPAFRPISSQEH